MKGKPLLAEKLLDKGKIFACGTLLRGRKHCYFWTTFFINEKSFLLENIFDEGNFFEKPLGMSFSSRASI